MPRISQSRIRRYLHQADLAATTPEKGAQFEALVAYLFETIPGVRVTDRNEYSDFDTEEIDVACWNDRSPMGWRTQNSPPSS